jgi:hypothetical protein
VRSISPDLPGRCGLFVLLLAGALGCSEEEPKEDCPARAAFHVVVRAEGAVLPGETLITVDHGAGTEEYRLDAPSTAPEILFCEPLWLDAGADAASTDASSVSCELWTQGATEVTVSAPGYPPLEKQLEVETEDGCIRTVHVELLLDAGDAASTP